jgi:hypothetical protein
MAKQTKAEMREWAKTWPTSEVRRRWVLLTFAESAEIEKLHKQEALLKKRCGYFSPAWQAPFLERVVEKNRLEPFWPPKVTNEEKHLRLRDFQKAIFQSWFPIVLKAWETESTAELHDKAKWFDEVRVLHDCDWAVWNSNVRVDREPPRGSGGARKSAVLDTLARAGVVPPVQAGLPIRPGAMEGH